MRNFFFGFYVFLLFPVICVSQSYFQQEVHYTINVKLDDVKNEITGVESIEYINNSSVELEYIYMHLWPNAYKDQSTALAKEFLKRGTNKFCFSTAEERGYIDQLDFKIDGQNAKWELLKDSIDICKIYLNQGLKSGGKVTITTPFHVKIPSGKFSRLGHIGQAYQMTQWYPKPAVYDNNGWNYMPYLNQGEFYSEFGTFDVSITLPKNYVLAATGDMVDAEKELEWLNQKVKETEAITTFDAKDLKFPVSDSTTKTIRFKQKNVHDFAWFCDKRFHVLKGEIETPKTKHKVITWAMFTNAEADLWKNSVQYINDAIYYYSLWNGDYPYDHCTAVDGTISAGGGMEYPNITVIGSSSNAFQLELVIAHEVGHNWFYGMLGSNEREHPWMDEGINSFNELRYLRTKYPEQKLIGKLANGPVGKIFDLSYIKKKAEKELLYFNQGANNQDQAIELPAYNFTEMNYGAIVYSKTAILFDYLMGFIGEKEMDKAMMQYFDEWHYKHPQPKDLRKILEKSTGKDLNWFFDDMINTTKKLDYKITACNKQEDGTWKLNLKNKGEIAGPFSIQGIKDNKVVHEINFNGIKDNCALKFPVYDIDYFKIDNIQNMPEIDRNNNSIRTRGILPKLEPFKLQLLASIDNPDKTQLFFTPAIGWNNNNKWMLGFSFHNYTVPQKKFQFDLMPLLSYSTKDFAGYGRMKYDLFLNNNLIHAVSFVATANRYSYTNYPTALNFNKIAPELNIEFKKKHARSGYTHSLQYRNISIFKDYYKSNYSIISPSFSIEPVFLNFNELNYVLRKSSALRPFNIKATIQQGEDIVKTSLTGIYTYKFKKNKTGINFRLFMGTFVGTSSANAAPYKFRLSGQNGNQDYLFDNIYIGRNETGSILANQFLENDGGFKYFSTIGQSSKWLVALNIKSAFGNLKLPVKMYFDIGKASEDALQEEMFLYNGGLCVTLIKNVFEIYLPILLSADLKNYAEQQQTKYIESVRFVLNLNLLNPFNLIRSF